MTLVDQAVPVPIEPTEPAPPAAPAGRPWARWAVAVAVTLVALAPIIAVLVQRWGRVYVPTGDQATLDLRIRDVWTFSADTPLTGPYSRFGWNHPGPTMYYLLALFSGVARQRAWASLVGSILLQGIAVVWIARLSWKAGGLRWMVPWLTVVTLSYWATGPWIYLQLWNPYLPFPFFTLLLLQAWLVGSGQGKRLVGMAFVASFLIQTHVGYAVPVMAVSLWAVIRLVMAEHRAGRHLGGWALWRAPLAVLAVVWFVPVVLDTALHFPGNLTRVVRYSLGLGPTHPPASLGLHGALGYLAAEFRWRPPWLGGLDPVNQYTSLTSPSSVVYLILPAALIGISWFLARRRRRADLVALVELLAVAALSGILALTLLTGPAFPYLFLWRIPVAASVVVLSLVVVAEAVGAARRPVTVALCCGLAILTAVASISFTGTVARATGPVFPMEPVAQSIIGQLHHDHQPRGKVLLRVYGTPLGGLHAALVDQLARDGDSVYVDRDLGFQFGPTRTAAPSQVGAVWYVIEESELYSLVTRIPGVRVLAASHPLPANQEAELVALQRSMADRLAAEGRSDEIGALGSEDVGLVVTGASGIPPAEVRRLAALNREVVRRTCLCAVVAVPADHIPPLLRES